MAIYSSWEEAPKTFKLICVTLGRYVRAQCYFLSRDTLGPSLHLVRAGHKIVISILVTVILVLKVRVAI
jgi:hypothetical protein